MSDAVDQGFDCAGGFLPEQRLELGEGHLDRVHVGAVGRQIEELSATAGDGLDEGHRLPVAEGNAIAAPFADRRPAIEPRHLRVDAGLIEEDEAMRIDERLCRLPQRAPRRHVGPVLLGRAQGFF